MKTKNIFKTVAFAMLIPTMLLTTSCSSGDDAFNNAENTETVAKKGYTLPVTVNASRENNGMRAAYDAENKKLYFSAGDKLFIKGEHATAGLFAGVLDYVSDGSFNGTITTENPYPGTAHELFKSSISTGGFLMPDSYEVFHFYTYEAKNGYDATVSTDFSHAIALTKATAVEQFSNEWGSYSYTEDAGNFVLEPHNAIVFFTINDFPEAKQNYDIEIAYQYVDDSHIVNKVKLAETITTDKSGAEIFAIGVANKTAFNNSFEVTVGTVPIHIANSGAELEAGKIYNITRDLARSILLATTADIGKLVGLDGKIYTSKASATAGGTTAVAMIAYVEKNGDYAKGLAIALEDESGEKTWAQADAIWENKNKDLPVTYAKWQLPAVDDWQKMFIACGATGTIIPNPDDDYTIPYTLLNDKIVAAGGKELTTSYNYWTLTEITEDDTKAYSMKLWFGTGNAKFYIVPKNYGDTMARACLAFKWE